MTNFEKYTQSHEALAATIYSYILNECTEKCPAYDICNNLVFEGGCEGCIAYWLNKEAESEGK